MYYLEMCVCDACVSPMVFLSAKPFRLFCIQRAAGHMAVAVTEATGAALLFSPLTDYSNCRSMNSKRRRSGKACSAVLACTYAARLERDAHQIYIIYYS